jgi:hypothetical protein
MNIPESAIHPFEPHGVPKLYARGDAAKAALSQVIIDINKNYGKHWNRRMIIDGLRTLLEGTLRKNGAEYVNVKISGPITKYETPHCNATILYKMPGGTLRAMFTPIWSTGGFK